MNKNGIIGIVIIVVLVILAIVGYASYSAPTQKTNDTNVTDTNTNSPSPTGDALIPVTTTTDSTTTVTTTTPKPATKTFTVTGSNFSFSPSALTVDKGDKVVINFVNSGGTHDFKIDEFNVATAQISGGESQTVTFTADKAGTFEYYCSVGQHRQMGMVGTLTVK